MIYHTCFKCKRHFEIDPVFVGLELSKLKKKNPDHYQAVCPACRTINKISVQTIQPELDKVADEIKQAIVEEEERLAAQKKAKSG